MPSEWKVLCIAPNAIQFGVLTEFSEDFPNRIQYRARYLHRKIPLITCCRLRSRFDLSSRYRSNWKSHCVQQLLLNDDSYHVANFGFFTTMATHASVYVHIHIFKTERAFARARDRERRRMKKKVLEVQWKRARAEHSIVRIAVLSSRSLSLGHSNSAHSASLATQSWLVYSLNIVLRAFFSFV